MRVQSSAVGHSALSPRLRLVFQSRVLPEPTRQWLEDGLSTVITAALVVAGLVLFAVSPTRDLSVAVLAIDVVVAAALAAAALVLSREPDQAGNARLVALACASWLTNLSSIGPAGPLPWLAWVTSPLFWIFLGWALLRYPAPRLASRGAGLLVTAMMVWVGPVHAATGFVLDPRWFPRYFPAGIAWPGFLAHLGLYESARLAYYIGAGVLAVAYVAVAIKRWLALHAVDRWLAAPVAASVVAVVVPAANWLMSPLLTERSTRLLIGETQTAILPLVPLALLTAVLRRRLIRTSIAEVVLRLTAPATTGSVRDALRTALRDPHLRVFVWVEDAGYVDEQGEQADPAAARTPGLLHEVRGPDGAPLAVVVVDPALSGHRDLLEIAASASAHSLQNARLNAVLTRELSEVAASRRRLVETAMAQRRNIERDLHDGVQQRLLALALTLAAARDTGGERPHGELAELLDEARSELHQILEEVRDLAHGIHPAVLSSGGLRAALEDVLERLPLSTRMEATTRRFSPAVESTAYYIACEALSNVVKHSGARHADVRVREVGDSLVLEIIDNGQGGSDLNGHGIRGMADRAAALGGTLEVKAVESGSGTAVIAVIPCE